MQSEASHNLEDKILEDKQSEGTYSSVFSRRSAQGAVYTSSTMLLIVKLLLAFPPIFYSPLLATPIETPVGGGNSEIESTQGNRAPIRIKPASGHSPLLLTLNKRVNSREPERARSLEFAGVSEGHHNCPVRY